MARYSADDAPPASSGMSDSFSVGVKAVDGNVAPSDPARFAVAFASVDSNIAPTETAKLGLTGSGLSDSTLAPTDSKSALIRVWLSATAVVSTNGVTGAANANGSSDGTVASYQSVAAGDANPRTTSALGGNVPSVSFTTAIYRGWFKSVNVLATSTAQIVAHSTTAAFTDVIMFSTRAATTTIDHLSGDFTFDLIAGGIDTLAKLQSMQIVHSTRDSAAGVSPIVLTVDAGACDISGVF